MFQFTRWLSLYWFILIPISSLLSAGFLFRNQRRKFQDVLVPGKVFGWVLLAFLTVQLIVVFLLINSFLEASIWPAVAALVSIPLLFLSHHFIHKNLHQNFKFQFLRDSLIGLNKIEDGSHFSQIRLISLWAAQLFLPFLPGVIIITYVLIHQVERWPGLWLIIIPYLAPILIATWKRKQLWLVSSALTLVSLVFGLHALKLKQTLPQGSWITPITSASCSSTVQLDLERKYAWCANEKTSLVYQFTPFTGFVDQGLFIANSSQTFAGNNSRILIMQNPLKGLVLVENGEQTQIKINYARQGTVDREGNLWVIDVTDTLWVSKADGDWKRLKAVDGLLSNTANVVKTSPTGSVWVGSIGGVNRLVEGATEWQIILRSGTLPGIVQDFAFTLEGEVWYLWEAASAYQERVRWGVSIWKDFQWKHIELGTETGLDYPTSPQAVAIDGIGRIWFVAPSYIQKTNFLGILEPRSGVISLYRIGPFDITPGEGFPIPGYNGVVDDGHGGIFLYNPAFEPLRHWKTNKEKDEYSPCIQPCGIANIMDSQEGLLIVDNRFTEDVFLNHQED